MTRIRADILLFVTSFIWGTAFIAQKYANLTMGPITFVGVRFLFSSLALIPFVYYEHKKLSHSLERKDLLVALIIGVSLFAGAALQQIGLVTTTATNAGFLTALYVVIVPFVVWALMGTRPRPLIIMACALSLLGAWLLANKGPFHRFVVGDIVVILSVIAFSIEISLIPIFLKKAPRPFLLCFIQCAVTAVLGILFGFGFESFTWHGLSDALPFILYTSLLSGGVGYTLQIIAQKYTPPSEAALIMSLESVFAALSGAILLGEKLTAPAALGCLFILLGVCLVSSPGLMKGLRGRSAR